MPKSGSKVRQAASRLPKPNVRNTNIGMAEYTPARMGQLLEMGGVLETVAQELARAARKRAHNNRKRIKRGATLRPCDETPLWNALVSHVQPRLAKRGARALLARELDLHRARIGEYFFRRTAMPDAERTLTLLLWLARQPTTAGVLPARK